MPAPARYSALADASGANCGWRMKQDIKPYKFDSQVLVAYHNLCFEASKVELRKLDHAAKPAPASSGAEPTTAKIKVKHVEYAPALLQLLTQGPRGESLP